MSEIKLSQRRGKIKIHRNILFGKDQLTDEKILKLLFANFIPVYVYNEFDFYYYSGMSDFFDPINEGECIPEYDVKITCVNNGIIITFERLENE